MKLYYSSAQGTRAGNLLLCTVKLRHKSLRIHVYFAQRQRERWQQEKSGAREGGKESISSTPCSPQMNLSCSFIFSLPPSLFFPRSHTASLPPTFTVADDLMHPGLRPHISKQEVSKQTQFNPQNTYISMHTQSNRQLHAGIDRIQHQLCNLQVF